MNVSPLAARHFLRRALHLDTPHPDVATALAHHGYVQIDPINICGRMHDLILRNRVAGYREGDLHRHIHSPSRAGFEHYLPANPPRPNAPSGVLVAYPIEAWPYLSELIIARRLRGGAYGRKLPAKYERLAARIIDEITRRGPLTSDDIEHEGTSLTGWGTPGRLVKNLLEILFVHGRVLITTRRNFRRVYDLPERVLPPHVLNAPPAPPAEVARWSVLLRLRQRRLVALTKEQFRHVDDAVQQVKIKGCPTLFCLRDDAPLLDLERGLPARNGDGPRAGETPALPGAPRLLAPLDPLIYDRRVTSRLWNFDYTWEVYTPAAKRVRGYYALPILAGTEIVGHVDLKADRPARTLVVMSRRIRRGYRITPALREFARWLGLR